MYAGVEHLGRATADAVDAMLVVVEPTARSLGTAKQIMDLANDLKMKHLFLVGSKIQGEEDLQFIRNNSPGLDVLGSLADDPRVRQADREGLSAYDLSPELAASAKEIIEKLEQYRQT
jgi:CO dehydrogenase maturation factor